MTALRRLMPHRVLPLLTVLALLALVSTASAATTTTPQNTAPDLLLPGLHCVGYDEQKSVFENFCDGQPVTNIRYAIPGELCGTSDRSGVDASGFKFSVVNDRLLIKGKVPLYLRFSDRDGSSEAVGQASSLSGLKRCKPTRHKSHSNGSGMSVGLWVFIGMLVLAAVWGMGSSIWDRLRGPRVAYRRHVDSSARRNPQSANPAVADDPSATEHDASPPAAPRS